ncbi:MAG: YolD-like family protein [Oscillospiraceae bacterium]
MAGKKGDRAVQFMPFASLKGYYDQIREQERLREPRRELSEDEAEELSAALNRVERGTMLRVVYYNVDFYDTVEGMVSEFDPVFRRLKIVRREIAFDDIFRVEFPESGDMAGQMRGDVV